MKAVEIADAAGSLAKYARAAGTQPVVLTLNAEPIAALVGLENVDIETLALSSSPKFIALIEKSRARYQKEGGLSAEEVRRRLKKPAKRP